MRIDLYSLQSKRRIPEPNAFAKPRSTGFSSMHVNMMSIENLSWQSGGQKKHEGKWVTSHKKTTETIPRDKNVP